MPLQQILFYASLVMFIAGGLCAIAAIYVFFAKHVPDVHADLTGKKRAQAVEDAARTRQSRSRRGGGVQRSVQPVAVTPAVSAQSAAVAPAEVGAYRSEASKTQAAGAGKSAVFVQAHEPGNAPAVAATTILPDDDGQTVILQSANEPYATARAEAEQAVEQGALVDFTRESHRAIAGGGGAFAISQRIFLTDSTQYVAVIQR